jgi:dihydrofolate synthase/folylpolyglutamate synthase
VPLTSSIRSAGAKPIRSLERQLARLIERGRGGARLGLERMEEALALLDDPQAGLRCVHIAGTNGKGSTAAMVEAIARRAGLKTGLYTSPHLCRFNERIQIDGGPIDDDAFAAALARALHRELPPLSLFETMTVAAFVAFA